MKKAVFFALLLIILSAVGSYAAPAIKDVTELLPNISTAQQVDEKLGKPHRIDKSLGQMVWYYDGEGYSLAIMWDMQSSKVTKYAFTSHLGKGNEWDAKETKSLIAGQTTMDDMITQLGTPNEIIADMDAYTVQYQYKNNTVQLRFTDGKLKDYAVTVIK